MSMHAADIARLRSVLLISKLPYGKWKCESKLIMGYGRSLVGSVSLATGRTRQVGIVSNCVSVVSVASSGTLSLDCDQAMIALCCRAPVALRC